MYNKKYMFRATLTALEPFGIGSGEDDVTNSDVLVDASHSPFIPGTSVSGVLRHYLEDVIQFQNTSAIFGQNIDNDEQINSNIIFYDCSLIGDCKISIRDSVALGDNKVALDGQKFDRQIVEAGAKFELFLELSNESDRLNDESVNELLNYLIVGINSGDIRFGGKANRGQGLFEISQCYFKKYDLRKPKMFANFINFDKYSIDTLYEMPKKIKSNRYDIFNVSLELASFLFIRNYVTNEVDKNNDFKSVDAEQLLNKDKKPIIPGTSWAGVFRHSFERILGKAGVDATEYVNSIFGYAEKDTENKQASKIRFGESVLEGSKLMNRTRTAIDRFTGGAANKMLFTTRPAYGGTTTLKIMVDKNASNKKLCFNLIKLTLEDINSGVVNVGGEGATGAGIFKVNNVIVTEAKKA